MSVRRAGTRFGMLVHRQCDPAGVCVCVCGVCVCCVCCVCVCVCVCVVCVCVCVCERRSISLVLHSRTQVRNREQMFNAGGNINTTS